MGRLSEDKDVAEMGNKLAVSDKPFIPVYIQAGPIGSEDGSDSDDESNDCSVWSEEVIGGTSDKDDDEWADSIEARKKVHKETVESKKRLLEACLKPDVEHGSVDNDGVEQDGTMIMHTTKRTEVGDEAYSSYEDSDGDVNSPGESEDDNIRGKKYKLYVPVISELTKWKGFNWVAGIRFPTRDAFKEAIRRYAVCNGKNLVISVSDKSRQGRLGVSCVEGCPFFVYCSFHKGKQCYMVKKAKKKHNCQRNMTKNRQLTSKFIASEFLEMFKARPNWPAKEILLAVKEKYKQFITMWLAYKAKSRAHGMLHGSMKEHYGKLGSYLACLRSVNPTSTFHLMTAPPADPTSPDTFFRLFICFDGVKRGFLAGCRKLLCLDGCFLKTFLGGMLLAAVGRDGNDQMFPVAWAVVEGENNESWNWFMEELRSFLGVYNGGEGWTLVSDQQKGLLNAVCSVWPNVEHRNCARHIYANWHKTFKGDDLKGAFWETVRSYNEADYNLAIEGLKTLSNDGYDAFIKQNPKCFSRCFLNTESNSDVIVNNMAETFNGYIVQSRNKHLIDMLEDIRVAIMSRLIKKHMEMVNKDFVVCPKIQLKLDKEKNWSYKCEVYPSALEVFQVRDKDDVSVDLLHRTCTCRKCDLTGIPCKHVCAVADFLRKPVEDFIEVCYTKPVYMMAYEFTIPPLPSQKYWPIVVSPLDPPPIKKQPGRPKKNRIRDPHEDTKTSGKLSKHGVTMSCSICRERGHNKSKCTKVVEPVAKRPRGRPKKVVAEAEQQDRESTRGRGRGRGLGRGRGRGGTRGGASNQAPTPSQGGASSQSPTPSQAGV